MIKIITDSSSDIRPNEAIKLGIKVLPISVSFGETVYKDGLDLSVEEFYQKLTASKVFPKTAQVPLVEWISLFEEAKAAGDTLVVLPISSKISGTYQTAVMAKNDVGYENIYVIDSLSTIGTLRFLVLEANKMKDKMPVEKLIEHVEYLRSKIRCIAFTDTLEYFQKGGRISKVAAMVGTVLNLKPIISIVNGEIHNLAKNLGINKSIEWIKNYIAKNPIDERYPTFYQYSYKRDWCDKLIDETSKTPDEHKKTVQVIGPVVGSHVGPGAAALIYIAK